MGRPGRYIYLAVQYYCLVRETLKRDNVEVPLPGCPVVGGGNKWFIP